MSRMPYLRNYRILTKLTNPVTIREVLTVQYIGGIFAMMVRIVTRMISIVTRIIRIVTKIARIVFRLVKMVRWWCWWLLW